MRVMENNQCLMEEEPSIILIQLVTIIDKIVLISTHLHPECYLNPVKDLSNNNHTGTLQVFFTPYFSPPLK